MARRTKSTKKYKKAKKDKNNKKAKKEKKRDRKKEKKEKKKATKLKKALRKKKQASSATSSSSLSTSSSEETPIDLEETRESIGLKLLGDLYSRGKPDSNLKWQYLLRDEGRRCFVGLLQPMFPVAKLKHLYNLVQEGTMWDQPKRPQTGELLPRKTDWMVAERCRCRYKYGGVEVDPSEFPAWMEEIMEVCMPLCGLRGRASWPNCCNLNLYEDGGMSVGWHSDDEALFQGKVRDCPIISFSLGEQRTFELRVNEPKGDSPPHCKILLQSGDLLTMEGLTQKHYQHRVPKERAGGARINLTWRWIREHQARCPLSRAK